MAISTDALDSLYRKLKPKGVTMTALLAKVGWMLEEVAHCGLVCLWAAGRSALAACLRPLGAVLALRLLLCCRLPAGLRGGAGPASLLPAFWPSHA